MKYVALLMLAAFIACAAASCVEVTTARKTESVSPAPGGGEERHSEVTVKTYGWDALDVAIHVVTFPFKVIFHAVKLVL